MIDSPTAPNNYNCFSKIFQHIAIPIHFLVSLIDAILTLPSPRILTAGLCTKLSDVLNLPAPLEPGQSLLMPCFPFVSLALHSQDY